MKRTSNKQLLRNPVVLLALIAALLVLAAGIFFLVGTTATKVATEELPKLLPATASPSPRAKLSFANLIDTPLDPKKIETVAKDVSEPHGLAVFDGVLYASSWGDKQLYRIDLASGQRKSLADELPGVHDMVQDPEGRIIAADYKAGRVVRIERMSGKANTLAEGLKGPNGIARARAGGYFVTEAGGGRVVRLSPEGRVQTVKDKLSEPAGILSNNDNILLVAQYADTNNAVIQILDNGTTSTVVRGLANAETLLRDDENNVIIGHQVNGKAALSIFPRGQEVRPLLVTDLPGPMVGPVTDGKYLYFESAAPGQTQVYRIALP